MKKFCMITRAFFYLMSFKDKMILFWYVSLLGLLCHVDASDKQEEVDCSVSDLMNSFSFEMNHRLSMENEKENLVFSPYSIYSALAMLSVGANSTTKEQINAALKWKPGDDHWSGVSLMRTLIEDDSDDVDAVLKVANNAWLSRDLELLHNFQNKMVDIFGASFQREDFSVADTARDNINRWVSDHTGQRINDLFPRDSFDEMTKLVLANAVYFKGAWRKPFETEHTKMQEFTLEDGSKTKVPLMFKNSEFLSGVFRNVEVLELPYGSDGRFSMIFAKPRNTNEVYEYESNPEHFLNLASLCKNLDHDVITGMMESLKEEKIDVYVPKFTIKKGFSLIEKLKSLGVNDVFSIENADLSGITGVKDLYVSSAEHKAFIEVDETGTTAGAATGLGFSFMSMPREVRMDRPFLFFILNKRCNSIIFAGKVVDPTK